MNGTALEDDAPVQLIAVTVVVETEHWRGRSRDVRRTVLLDEVSLGVRRSECLGIVADADGGADTLLALLAGTTPPTSGEVRVPSDTAGGVRLVLPGTGPRADLRLTVEQHVGRGASGSEPATERRAEVLDALTTIGADPSIVDRPMASVSLVDRRRADVAQALLGRPEVLVIGPLTSGVGPVGRGQLLDSLLDLRRAYDLTLVVHDGDLAFLATISDRLAVLHAHRLVEIGPTQAIADRARHPYGRALFDAVAVPRPGGQRTPTRLRPAVVLPAQERASGCRFQPRCPNADTRCAVERPRLVATTVGVQGHDVACFHPVS